MAFRRRADLGDEERLALTAAVADRRRAVAAWCALMNSMRFDEVNENTQRIMPAIFHNLRDVPDVPERDRLRGAFKHRWSKNTGMLFDLRPVLRDLDDQGVGYRVIKGAAVQAVCGSMGARIMGDVDLLTDDAEIEAISAALIAHGYRPSASFGNAAGTLAHEHPHAGHADSWNFNKGSSHVDLHVAGRKAPVRLLSSMMALPASHVRADGGAYAVPAPELLMLHAAVHGGLSSGPTDLMQAALDVSLLRPFVDPTRLLSLAQETGTLTPLMNLDRALSALGLPGSGAHTTLGARTSDRVAARGRRAVGLVTESTSLGRRVRDRRPSEASLAAIRAGFPGRAAAYTRWVAWGRFASLERRAVSRWGGFLTAPKGTWSGEAPVRPFEEPSPGITASSVAARALDWRVRIQLPQRMEHAWLHLESAALDRLDTFVFCNGVPLSRVVAGDLSTRVIGLGSVGPTQEISVRPLWNACEDCYSGFDDLEITVDDVAPES